MMAPDNAAILVFFILMAIWGTVLLVAFFYWLENFIARGKIMNDEIDTEEIRNKRRSMLLLNVVQDIELEKLEKDLEDLMRQKEQTINVRNTEHGNGKTTGSD